MLGGSEDALDVLAKSVFGMAYAHEYRGTGVAVECRAEASEGVVFLEI